MDASKEPPYRTGMIENNHGAPRSFTIRVPQDLYLRICECSAADDLALNVKVNQLLKLGLGEHTNLNATLARMLVKLAVEETVE